MSDTKPAAPITQLTELLNEAACMDPNFKVSIDMNRTPKPAEPEAPLLDAKDWRALLDRATKAEAERDELRAEVDRLKHNHTK